MSERRLILCEPIRSALVPVRGYVAIEGGKVTRCEVNPANRKEWLEVLRAVRVALELAEASEGGAVNA